MKEYKNEAVKKGEKRFITFLLPEKVGRRLLLPPQRTTRLCLLFHEKNDSSSAMRSPLTAKKCAFAFYISFNGKRKKARKEAKVKSRRKGRNIFVELDRRHAFLYLIPASCSGTSSHILPSIYEDVHS